jgi:hypothetical protein
MTDLERLIEAAAIVDKTLATFASGHAALYAEQRKILQRLITDRLAKAVVEISKV